MSRRMLSRKQCVFVTVVLPLLIVPALLIIHKAGARVDDVFLPPPRRHGNVNVSPTGASMGNRTAVFSHVRAPQKPRKCFEYIWNGSCRDTCFSFNILAKQRQRKQLVMKCDKSRSQLQTQYYTKQKYVYKVPFKDTCLRKVVDWYCHDNKRVPNIVHYVWFGKREFTFINFLSFLSVYKIQNPCLIMVHADKMPKGNLWNYFLQICPKVVHVKRKQPKRAQKKKLTFIEHKADVAKLEALEEYGGIYVDTDQLILKPLTKFRNSDSTIGLDYQSQAANSLILAKSNAAFIKAWQDSYRTFSTKNDGNKHSQIIPFKLAMKSPGRVEIAGNMFSGFNAHRLADIYKKNVDWTRLYGLHLHEKLHNNFFPGEKITMDSIKKSNTTVGAVARWILYGNTELCLSKTIIQ